MFKIYKYEFNTGTSQEVGKLRHNKHDVGNNWPVVYVINNDDEAYVGETVNAARRIDQHLQNEDRQRLTEIRIISDETFNKSVILDLESFLIKYMASDGKYSLQNGNAGIRDHEYYSRLAYQDEFKKIWNALRRKGVAQNPITDIENSELYKYSPYKSLGKEQFDAEMQILKAFSENRHENGLTILVQGGAGTGKTILGIYLMKLFADIKKMGLDELKTFDEYTEEDVIAAVYAAENIVGIDKIGLVIPQKSLQTSLKKVFDKVQALDKTMVLSPNEVVKNYIKTGKYDLLIVDEGHRLKCHNHGNVANHKVFKDRNRDLGLDLDEGNELDWIMLCSENRIIFRDKYQTVRPCDIYTEEFNAILTKKYDNKAVLGLNLDTQWRCAGGDAYVKFVKKLLSGERADKQSFEDYDFSIYSDCNQMIRDIKAKEQELGLCRVVAGFAWPWDRNDTEPYTIEIQGYKYRWNRTYDNWISTPTAIDEIGCIHTVQGYDLNYCGVIVGEELRYDKANRMIYVDKNNYYDQHGKSGVADDPEALKDYIINIYTTLMTRGIKGTYVYVCDESLRKQLLNNIGFEYSQR